MNSNTVIIYLSFSKSDKKVPKLYYATAIFSSTTQGGKTFDGNFLILGKKNLEYLTQSSFLGCTD